MKPRMVLGDFLGAHLRRAGVSHFFGLPGVVVEHVESAHLGTMSQVDHFRDG